MYSFNNDYSEGAIPEIIEELTNSNLYQSVGYGMDEQCDLAKEQLHKILCCNHCDIHFLVGGTQANTTVISSALRPYQAVLATETGHINVHETGAIEATGHKVVIVDSKDGKVSVEGIYKAVKQHTDEHMVQPKMVYISNSTEIGTIYYKEELVKLHEACQKLGLYLFMDGARLGSALMASDNDVLISDLCNYVDVFTIGGTKNGALFGEAVVICHDDLKPDFRYFIKQHGGMLAKGRLLGLQYRVLFENNRYFTIAKHANEMAMLIQDAFIDLGYPLFTKTTTNQVFVILSNERIAQLQKKYAFQVWEEVDDSHTAMRFVTSWATPKCAVDAFIKDLKELTIGE